MEKSSATATNSRSEPVLQEPCGLLLILTILFLENTILTILTCCVSRIQSFHPSSCESCNHNPSNKSTPPAPVLTRKEVIKTRNQKHDDEMEVTYEDIKTVMRSVGLSLDHDSSMACGAIGSDYIPRLFDDDEPSLHEVRQAFMVFDENNDGYLDASDLRRVFRSLGLGKGAGLSECEQMIAKYDLNMDRRIDLVEFTKVLEASIC